MGRGNHFSDETYLLTVNTKITSRMVLSHSSGLPHGDPRTPLPIFFGPGTRYRYSADGYMYLQRVMEHLKGKPLEVIMKEMALDPLDMAASWLVWQERYEKEAAVGHDVLGETDGKFRKRTQAHAGATLYTTAKEYAQFVIAMMNDSGLRPETIREMLRPQIDVSKDVYWGIGFGLERTPRKSSKSWRRKNNQGEKHSKAGCNPRGSG